MKKTFFKKVSNANFCPIGGAKVWNGMGQKFATCISNIGLNKSNTDLYIRIKLWFIRKITHKIKFQQ